MPTENNDISIVPWKRYLKITAESLFAFYLATFCLAMFFMHQGLQHVVSAVVLVILYLFVVIVCAKRIFEQLSMPALMLVIPIAPLLALIIVVSLIPVIEWIHYLSN